jgi:hypothetical protein
VAELATGETVRVSTENAHARECCERHRECGRDLNYEMRTAFKRLTTT